MSCFRASSGIEWLRPESCSSSSVISEDSAMAMPSRCPVVRRVSSVRGSRGMRFRFAVLLALCAVLVAGCFGGGESDKAAAPKPEELTIRVATFNIFYGGDEMVLASRDWCTDPEGCQETFAAVADAIKQSKADIVGLQEATGNTRKVAEALGWNYNERTQIVSRFPIIDPGGADGLYVFVQPTPSTVVAVSNAHLPSSPYGPYRAQAG